MSRRTVSGRLVHNWRCCESSGSSPWCLVPWTLTAHLLRGHRVSPLFPLRSGAPSQNVHESAHGLQCLDGTPWEFDHVEGRTELRPNHPGRNLTQRLVGEANDKKLVGTPAIPFVDLHFFANQRMPGVADRGKLRRKNVSSLSLFPREPGKRIYPWR